MNGLYTLMDTLLPFEWLHYTFMKNALIAIVLLTPLFGMLGTMAVDNKMAFFSDALGHSALTGIAIGVVLGWQSQMSAMLLFGLIWAVLITFVKHHSKMSADTIISVFSSTSIALGLVVLSRGGAFAKYSSVLVGDVLSVAQSDLLALLLALVIGGLLYISAFSLVYLKKAYDHCLELGITRKELSNVIKSSLIFSVVPSLSIVVGLFVLIAVLGSVWAWWRLSVIGSLSYETMISSSIAQVLGYASSAEMLESATGRQFGVVMILMSVGMLSGFLILLPLGKKLCKSVDRSAAENGGSTWKNVLSGVFMLVMFSVYIPILLFTDNVQAAVMITGLVIAIGVGVLAKRPGLAWLNNFVMAFSMLGGLISSLAWVRIFV